MEATIIGVSLAILLAIALGVGVLVWVMNSDDRGHTRDRPDASRIDYERNIPGGRGRG